MDETNPPKFLDLLEEYEADDIATKISEIQTSMQDIQSKLSKRRPVQRERKALNIKVKDLVEQFFNVGVRPIIANSDAKGRVLDLSKESSLLLRDILVLATSGMDAQELKGKIMDHTAKFADSVWKSSGVTHIDAVDNEDHMWQPDPTITHYEDDNGELDRFNETFFIPELGASERHRQNQHAEDDDPCAITLEYKWEGQVFFDDQNENKEEDTCGRRGEDVDMEEKVEEPPAMLQPWYNPSVSSSKSGHSPPDSDDESEGGPESDVEEGSNDMVDGHNDQLNIEPKTQTRLSSPMDAYEDDNEQLNEGGQESDVVEGSNDVVDGHDDQSDSSLSRAIEEPKRLERVMSAERAERAGRGNSGQVGVRRDTMDEDEDWDPSPLGL